MRRILVWRPHIELTREDSEFAVRALVPGIDPNDIEVLVAPDLLLIKGETKGESLRGTVHRDGLDRRKIIRSIELPKAINPTKVHAELIDGMLSIKAEIAEGKRSSFGLLRAA